MTSPRIKVFDTNGKYQASTHDYAAAALLMDLYGDGATVRLGHSKRDIIWTEGADGKAGDSFEVIADAISAHDRRVSDTLDRMMRGGS